MRSIAASAEARLRDARTAEWAGCHGDHGAAADPPLLLLHPLSPLSQWLCLKLQVSIPPHTDG